MKKILILIFLFCALSQNNNSQTITDVDGNTYNTVTIGTQVWMKENLKVTRYRNGDLIGTTSPATLDITAQASPKYQWAFGGNEDNVLIYGRLYTWYAATDSRNVCPTGWHLPSDAEWASLEDYLIAIGYNYDGTTTENKIAKSLAATTNWGTSNNDGVPGNTDFSAKRNATGFTALGTGCRIGSRFSHLENATWWWTSLNYSTMQSRVRQMTTSSSYVVTYEVDKLYGLSVRCLKDIPTSSSTSNPVAGMVIYPNPVSNTLIVDNVSPKSVISIISIGGKLFKTTIANNLHTEISVSELPAGIYFLRVNGSVCKFVKL